MRDDGLRAGGPASSAARLTAAAIVPVGACAAIGAAVAGGRGAIVGIVLAGVLLAVGYAYGDRLALSAMAARPVSEVEHPELYRLVRELSKAGRLPVPRLYLSPAGQPNSFAVGRGPRTAAVCCTQGLLGALDEAELRGVLGHELAHVSGRDILAATASAGLATVITFPAGLVRLLPGRARAGQPAAPAPGPPAPPGSAASASWPSAPPGPDTFGPAGSGLGASGPAGSGLGASGLAGSGLGASGLAGSGLGASGLGLIEASLMLVLGPVAALVIRLAVTRAREYRADTAGGLLSGDPVALANALRKVEAGAADLPLAPDGRLTSVGHLMLACPFRPEGFARLFLTQPPAGERVRRLEALAGYRR
ncbi:MAG TPA: M48 family metalloprotease [Streptosporangiaceae bacterium]